jgi:hypothetical protein
MIRELDLRDSSNVKSASWDDETLELHCEFHSGSRGSYLAVPEHEVGSFERATSHGSYIHDYIKPLYVWRKG